MSKIEIIRNDSAMNLEYELHEYTLETKYERKHPKNMLTTSTPHGDGAAPRYVWFSASSHGPPDSTLSEEALEG